MCIEWNRSATVYYFMNQRKPRQSKQGSQIQRSAKEQIEKCKSTIHKKNPTKKIQLQLPANRRSAPQIDCVSKPRGGERRRWTPTSNPESQLCSPKGYHSHFSPGIISDRQNKWSKRESGDSEGLREAPSPTKCRTSYCTSSLYIHSMDRGYISMFHLWKWYISPLISGSGASYYSALYCRNSGYNSRAQSHLSGV